MLYIGSRESGIPLGSTARPARVGQLHHEPGPPRAGAPALGFTIRPIRAFCNLEQGLQSLAWKQAKGARESGRLHGLVRLKRGNPVLLWPPSRNRPSLHRRGSRGAWGTVLPIRMQKWNLLGRPQVPRTWCVLLRSLALGLHAGPVGEWCAPGVLGANLFLPERPLESLEDPAIAQRVRELPKPGANVLDIEIALAVDDAVDVGKVLRAAGKRLVDDQVLG